MKRSKKFTSYVLCHRWNLRSWGTLRIGLLLTLLLPIGVQAQSLPATDTLKAGDVAPEAVKLEVRDMQPFFGKSAVIMKVNSYALIDDHGQVIQPYNKYYYGNPTTVYPHKGGPLSAYQFGTRPIKLRVCQEISTKKTHILDVNGAVLTTDDVFTAGTYHGSGDVNFDDEGYWNKNTTYNGDFMQVRYNGKFTTVKGTIVMKGSKATLPPLAVEGKSTASDGTATYTIRRYTGGIWADGLQAYGPIQGPLMPGTNDTYQSLFGFVNRAGSLRIKPIYNRVSDFSEGLCFVAKINEFGEERWGAIDTLGKLVIPYKFVQKPGHFSNGRALISSFGTANKEYSYINRRGDIVIRLPVSGSDTTFSFYRYGDYGQDNMPGKEEGLFSQGYCLLEVDSKNSRIHPLTISGICRLDTAGNYFPLEAQIRKNIAPDDRPVILKSFISDRTFVFGYRQYPFGNGIADVDGNILLPPIFSKILPFEPESQLQYAMRVRQKPSYKEIEGYIDRKGIFRIIKTASSGY